jgi:hypothetical protein
MSPGHPPDHRGAVVDKGLESGGKLVRRCTHGVLGP